MKVGFVGNAGHAGTVPMVGRRDALCAAAEFVLEVEAAAKADPGAVATVGEISAHPGAVNVIPGEVEHSLDLRHADDAARGRIRDHLEKRAGEIAASRGCERRGPRSGGRMRASRSRCWAASSRSSRRMSDPATSREHPGRFVSKHLRP